MSKEPAQRGQRRGKASSNGQQPSEEYRRFESLMKRLVRTPKPAPEKAEPKRPA
jgi:hypothetical protein